MGIFNTQNKNNPFSRGIQGSPGVGFKLTVDGNFDITGKKLTNVGAPTANADAATKKYVDDNTSSHTSSGLTVNSNIDMKDRYRILNLKSPSDADEPATKQYADSTFLDRGGDRGMIANLVMNNNRIKRVAEPTSSTDAATKNYVDTQARTTATTPRNLDMQNRYRITNLQTPVDPHEPPTKSYVDNTFLERDGSYAMTGNLQMGNHKITGVRVPTAPSDATTKKYVDDHIANSSPDLSDYLEKDGTVAMTGNLNMGTKKIVNLATPTANNDAATKKYVDDKPSGGDFKKDGSVVMTGNLNMGGHKLANLATPTTNNDAATKKYVDDKPTADGDFKKDGSIAMTGNLNMNSKRIVNLPIPVDSTDAASVSWVKNQIKHFNVLSSPVFTLTPAPAYTTIYFQHQSNKFVATTSRPAQPLISWKPSSGTYINKMVFNLNREINLRKVSFVARDSNTSNVDFWISQSHTGLFSLNIHRTFNYELSGVFLEYVTDANSNHPPITTNIYTGKPSAETKVFSKIKFSSPTEFTDTVTAETPTAATQVATKEYVDKSVAGPAHYKNVFAYLMSSAAQWSDEITTRTSFVIKYIRDLGANQGNFHSFNHKAIFIGLKKYSGGYRPKFGINFYKLAAGDYTICIEFLTTDYTIWGKTKISVDHQTSRGLTFLTESVKKLQHSYIYPAGNLNYMYYHRLILSFTKSNSGTAFMHITVDIPERAGDMLSYPSEFTKYYIITYGVEGAFSNVDPDRSFDYHTAFDIQSSQVVFNVGINGGGNTITNIKEDPSQSDNSVATLGSLNKLKSIEPLYFYFNLFDEIWFFKNIEKYVFSSGGGQSSSALTFNQLKSLNETATISFPAKNLSNLENQGLAITNYTVDIPLPTNAGNLVMILVFYFWDDNNLRITRVNSSTNAKLFEIIYDKIAKRFILHSGGRSTGINLPSGLNGKKCTIWIRNTSSTALSFRINDSLSIVLIGYGSINARNQKIQFYAQGGFLNKVMYTSNTSLRSDKIYLQEKLV